MGEAKNIYFTCLNSSSDFMHVCKKRIDQPNLNQQSQIVERIIEKKKSITRPRKIRHLRLN